MAPARGAQTNRRDDFACRNFGFQGLPAAGGVRVLTLPCAPTPILVSILQPPSSNLQPSHSKHLPTQPPIWRERKQTGLRNAFRKCRLFHREVRAIRLYMGTPMLARVFFRPEENSLLSIIVNDVWTAERVPGNIGLEQKRRSAQRKDPPAQFVIHLQT